MDETPAVNRRWPLVGRADEIAALRRLLRTTLPAGLLLVGSAGVGKSRLLSELADLAAADGWSVESVAGAVSGGSVPMGAVGQLLPSFPTGEMHPGRFLVVCRELLVERYRDRRLLITVDDAPWLDAESAVFLAQLTVMGLGLVAFTARSEDPLPAPVEAMVKDRLVDRLAVEPLSDEAVGQLIRAVLGGQVGASATRRLVELAGGNPLFLRELIGEGIESGRLRTVDGRWELDEQPGISADLRRLIATRLGKLSTEQRDGLEMLAVAAPIEMDLAQEICGTAVLESLERRGIIRGVADGRRRLVEFQHPLFAETVGREVPATRRAGIAGRLIEVVTQAGGARRDDPLRIAGWHLAGGRPVDAATLTAAGWRAMLAGNPQLAERIGDAAIEAGGGDEAILIRAMAVAQLRRLEEADRLLAELSAHAGDDMLRARAASWRAEAVGLRQSGPAVARDILESARRDLTDPQARSIIDGELLMLRAYSLPQPGGALDEALRLANDDAAPDEARLQAALVALLLAVWLGRPSVAYEMADRAQRLFETAGPMVRHAQGRLCDLVAVAMVYDGRLPEAVEQLGQYYHRALRPPLDRTGVMNTGHNLAQALAINGRLDDAVEVIREALSVAPALAVSAAVIAAQARNHSLLRQALSMVDEASYGPPYPPTAEAWVPMARAWEAWINGDPATAAELAVGAGARALEYGSPFVAAWAYHHAIEFGHPQSAVEPLSEIAERTTAVAYDTWARHAAALTDGDTDRLESIADEYRDRQEYLHAVQAYVQAADLHRTRDRDHAAARAIAKAKQIAAITGQLDVWLPPDLPTHLTARETEVATLAAAGLTSRDIAGRLFISIRTVDNHLASVYTKLGIHQRSELAGILTPTRHT